MKPATSSTRFEITWKEPINSRLKGIIDSRRGVAEARGSDIGHSQHLKHVPLFSHYLNVHISLVYNFLVFFHLLLYVCIMPSADKKPRTLYDKVFRDHVVDERDDSTILLYIGPYLGRMRILFKLVADHGTQIDTLFTK